MATVQLIETRDRSASGADEPDDGGASLGHWLRRAREARGLTLDGITQETRIPRRHLEAIEHGDLGALPEFYQRAEVRAFARAVGVDEQLAVARLQSRVTPEQTHAERARPKPARRFPTVYGAVALVAAAIVVAALVGRTVFGGASVTAAASGTPGWAAELKSRPTPSESRPASSESDARDVSIPALAEAAPAPAPPGAVTELIITTQPTGARVTVNGIGWGFSPIAIKHLTPGDKRIRVSKDGYGAAERVLALSEGRRQAVDIPLTTAR